MSEDKITEKVYCYDHPSAYKQDNSALVAALMSKQNNFNPYEAAAFMNGGMNGGGWNNPFIYLVWLMFANRFFGNGGFENGQGQQNIEMQNQLQALRTQMQDNQNSNLLMDAIKGNASAINQLSSNLGCDFNSLKDAICAVRSGIDKVAGQVGFSAEKVINAVQLGNTGIITAIKDCCCQTQQAILRMGYENQLGQKDIINSMQAGFDRTNTGMERGFAQIGYDTQKQTCDIITAGTANTQRIIDTLNNHWNDENNRKIQDLKFQLSQKEQNEYFAKLMWQQHNSGCGCNTGCGCGCGC